MGGNDKKSMSLKKLIKYILIAGIQVIMKEEMEKNE